MHWSRLCLTPMLDARHLPLDCQGHHLQEPFLQHSQVPPDQQLQGQRNQDPQEIYNLFWTPLVLFQKSKQVKYFIFFRCIFWGRMAKSGLWAAFASSTPSDTCSTRADGVSSKNLQVVKKQCTNEILKISGFHHSLRYQRDLILWLDASVTARETPWGTILAEINSATKLFPNTSLP